MIALRAFLASLMPPWPARGRAALSVDLEGMDLNAERAQAEHVRVFRPRSTWQAKSAAQREGELAGEIDRRAWELAFGDWLRYRRQLRRAIESGRLDPHDVEAWRPGPHGSLGEQRRAVRDTVANGAGAS